ncbi:hypothetical protein OV203_50365 [Nannocystis sp. ILAH1]|nr:hypothetical protein [Nannocystis sp. ILAH1]MCY0995431.1 hypothetical protein [Nannocystis sp. ILAH1]
MAWIVRLLVAGTARTSSLMLPLWATINESRVEKISRRFPDSEVLSSTSV